MWKTVIYFILINLIFSSNTFSQNKRAHFSINNNKYSIPKDDEMDIMFANILDELVNNGETLNSDRNLWWDSYLKFINIANNGTYNIESAADYIIKLSYSGTASKDELGWDTKGAESNKRYTRHNYRKFPSIRMARITRLICEKVLMNYSEKK